MAEAEQERPQKKVVSRAKKRASSENLKKAHESQRIKRAEKLIKESALKLKEIGKTEETLQKEIESILEQYPKELITTVEDTRSLILEGIMKHLQTLPHKDLMKLYKQVPLLVIEQCGGIERLKAMAGTKIRGNSKEEDAFFKKVFFDGVIPLVKAEQDTGGGTGAGQKVIIQFAGASQPQSIQATVQGETQVLRFSGAELSAGGGEKEE